MLGRNWLQKIKLNWPVIKQPSSHNKRLEEILQKHVQLFEEGLGTLQGTKAKIHVDPTATPILHKARPVPYALREKIEQDLERLERAGTIEPVQYSEWANPIVPVWMAILSPSLMICIRNYLEVKHLHELDLSHAYE